MKHIIAIDCSGSTNEVTSYWEKVKNLVKEITSKEEEFSFIFWNEKAKQIGITEQALQEMMSMKGDGFTYPSTFIPFLPQVNDGITITIFTDGMINEPTGVEHCDNLLRARDIKIKQLNGFFIGNRNSMDLSVIASFLREERIPEKGMVYQQHINDSYKKYFFVDPSKELEKYFDNLTLFLGEADKLAEKFDLQNLGRTNQNKIFRDELAKLKNNLLDFILKKEKNKEKTNLEKIEKILKNLKEGKDLDAINNLNNLIDNNPNLALELDTAFKKLFVALDRKDGFQFNRTVTHIHNASAATQESNELLEVTQKPLNQDSTLTFTEKLAIPAAFDNFIIKKLILKRFAEKFPLHSFNKKLFKDEILKLFKETINSTISKDKILKLFKKTIEALPLENIQEEFFGFETKMDEVSREDILELFEKIKDKIFKNNFNEKYSKLTEKNINEVYNKIDQDKIYKKEEILILLINKIYPDELEEYENFKFMQKIFNENFKEEIEQEEIEAVEVFKLIYKIINEYSKDEILTLIDKRMSKIYQAINLKLFEKTMQDKRLVPTKTEVFDEATQKIISINVSVIDVMTQRFKYFYLNNPTVFLCDSDLVQLAEQSLDLEMKNNKQFPSFISTSTIDQFFGIATSAGERPLWLANLYLIIKNQNQFNQESKLVLKERLRDQFCKEENYLTLSNLPEHGPILKVPLIIAIWYIVISPKLIKDFRHNRLRTIGTKYHLDLLDELNLPYNKAETLHRLARYKLFAWMMDIAKEDPKKLENWQRSFYQKSINCDGALIFLDGAADYDLKTLKIGIFENKGYDTKSSPIICFSNENKDKAAENPNFVDTLSLSEVYALYKLVDPKGKTEEIDIDSNIDGLLKDPLLSQTFTPVIHYNTEYNHIKLITDDPTQICHFTLRPYKVSDETIENKFGSKDKQLFAYKYLGNFVAQFEKFPTSDEFLIYMAEKQSQKANPKNTLPAIPIIHKIASNIINKYKEALDHFLLNIDKLQNILKESSLKESKKTEFQNILNKRKCLSEKSEGIQATATANISLFIEITKFFNRAPSEFRDQLEKAEKEISKIPCTLKDEPSSLFFNQRRSNELGNQLEKAYEEIPENQSTLQEEPLSIQNTYRKVS